MNYRFHPGAEAEHLEQIAFYQSRQQDLGSRNREHFLETMQKICETPTRYPIQRDWQRTDPGY